VRIWSAPICLNRCVWANAHSQFAATSVTLSEAMDSVPTAAKINHEGAAPK
jgi:hypothetical protein